MPKDRAPVPAGTIFSDWLSQESLHAELRINVNGMEMKDDDDIGFLLADDDRIIIYDQPKDGGLIGTILNPLEHFNPIKFTQKIMNGLIKQPSASGIGTQGKTSSNNSVKGQTNLARNGEAKPDNFGLIRSFPDLIQESLFEYNNNDKYQTEWMNFGLGRYDVSNVRYSESSLTALAGASYSVYQPGDMIGNVNVGFAFDDVDGQEILGANENDGVIVQTATSTNLIQASFINNQAKIQIVRQDSFGYFFSLPKPHAVTFTVNVTYATGSGNVTRDATFGGSLISAVQTDNGSVTAPIYYYTFVIGSLTGADAGTVPANATINLVKFVINDNQGLVSGPYFSAVESTQIWTHMVSQLGPTDGTTNWVTKIWKVDGNNNAIAGTEQSFSYSVDNPYNVTTKTYYNTYKLTPSAGLGRYAVSFYRTNNSNSGNKLTVEAIHAVNIRTNVTYPNDCIVRVTVQSTENATSQRERKYNALINRHVISYSMTTQTVDYAERASRKFADIALFNWLVRGKQPETSIDIYGLYQIQAALDAIDIRLSQCDYTFDDEDVSLGSRMETICDAAGVSVYWDGGVLCFTLDARRDKPVTVFNRSNTTAEGYSLSYDMTLPGGYDGVEVQYRSPSTNKQAFIRYRVRNGGIELGQPVKAKKFEMMYIRDDYQADYRAQKECRRLIYSRMSMAITALADGEWVNVGDMVQVADSYDTNQQAGYIVSRNGNDFETNERITFSGSMFVVITDAMGATTSRYPAIRRSDTDFGFTAAAPDIDLNIFDGDDVQSPSRYVIATAQEMDATQWVITEKQPGNDGTTALSLAEYSNLIYP